MDGETIITEEIVRFLQSNITDSLARQVRRRPRFWIVRVFRAIVSRVY